MAKRVFIAATRQNEGKTTVSLGLLACLSSKVKNLGFIKPVGQRYIEVEGHKIDEDAVLIRDVFQMPYELSSMSPVAISKAFHPRLHRPRRRARPQTPDMASLQGCRWQERLRSHRRHRSRRSRLLFRPLQRQRRQSSSSPKSYSSQAVASASPSTRYSSTAASSPPPASISWASS